MNKEIRAAITAAEEAAKGDENDRELDALWAALRLCEEALTPPPDSFYTGVKINVLTESLERAREAIAFLQMGQRDRISLEITDDMIQVFLDEGKLTYPFDPSEPTEREVWYQGPTCEGPTYGYLGDDEESDLLMQEIDEAFSCLGAYAYDAAAAAIDNLTGENRTKED